jgi:hypothetical protein
LLFTIAKATEQRQQSKEKAQAKEQIKRVAAKAKVKYLYFYFFSSLFPILTSITSITTTINFMIFKLKASILSSG